MKTMCLPGYHHNDFVVTHVLGLMMYGTSFGQVHELPQRHCGDKQEATLFFIYIYIYMVFITEGFFEVVIESWPEWDLNP